MSQLRFVTRPPVPIDALRLQEDIRDLEEARKHLAKVDPDNVTEDRETGWKILQLLRQELRLCQRYAEAKLRREYLAPSRKRVSAKDFHRKRMNVHNAGVS